MAILIRKSKTNQIGEGHKKPILLRCGFIIASLLAGASISKTVEVSRHKDHKSTLSYFEDMKQFDGHAAEGLL